MTEFTKQRIITISIPLFVVLLLDQITKKLADIYLKTAHIYYYLWDMVQIRYAENTGAWGGLGSDLPTWGRIAFLQVVPLIFLIVLFVYVVSREEFKKTDLIAFGLILGGGVGNLIDRAVYGYVIDFAYIGIGQFGPGIAQFFEDHLFKVTWFDLAHLGTNIFNVADVAIMAGTIYILVAAFFNRNEKPAHEKSPASSDSHSADVGMLESSTHSEIK